MAGRKKELIGACCHGTLTSVSQASKELKVQFERPVEASSLLAVKRYWGTGGAKQRREHSTPALPSPLLILRSWQRTPVLCGVR
jgi:hypothetical protein